MSVHQTKLELLREALDSDTLHDVRRTVQALHPAEIGNILESLPQAERLIVWELVEPDNEGDVLLEVNDEVRAGLIEKMDTDDILAAADGMEVDDLADLIIDLPEAITKEVLRSMDQRDRERLESVMAYAEDTAGGLTNTDTITVRTDVTVEVVLRYLRLRGEIPETTDSLFVVNRFDEYLGVLELTRLLTVDPHQTVAEIMRTDVEGIPADTPQSSVAKLFEDLDLISAAVVNDKGKLIGRITVDDVVDVIRDEAEHSLMSMAGLDEDEDMFAPVITSARRRAVWLGANLITALLAAWVVDRFEATLEKAVILAVLMGVVASMGGIAGSQTLTLVIRGIALGHVEKSNARFLLTKEIAVGFLNGMAWALILGGVVALWFDRWDIAAVIAAATAINLLVAALAGVSIPLVLKRLGVDPALAGPVVLTTITDVIGFMAFLGLGAIFLT